MVSMDMLRDDGSNEVAKNPSVTVATQSIMVELFPDPSENKTAVSVDRKQDEDCINGCYVVCHALTVNYIIVYMGDHKATDIQHQVMQKYVNFEHLTMPRIFSNVSPAPIEIVVTGHYDGVPLGLSEGHHQQVHGAHYRYPHQELRISHHKRQVFMSEIENCRNLIQVNDNIATVAAKLEAKIVNAMVMLFPKSRKVTENKARLAEEENSKWLKNVC